jgi:hypothetical protein
MDGGFSFLSVAAVGAGLFIVIVVGKAVGKRRKEEERKRAAAERQRVEECGRVVLDFANHVGYIARQVISKDELESLIDEGISPENLGAEISRRINETAAMIIGYQPIGGRRLDVRLTQEFRDRHVYIIGKSGSGKTTLLRTMIMQDLGAGHGLAVIAPEAEMLNEELLPFIPDERIRDVIYFNPADSEAPVSFNPLYLDEGEDPDLKVDELQTIFRRILGQPGPRMDEILRQTFAALVVRKGSTLLDVERLLDRSDDSLRHEVIAQSERRGAHFWREVYPSFPKDAHLPITNRLGRFLCAKSVRAMLCNPSQSLNFRQAMDTGKVMLFNVSDGLLGEQNSQLLGQLIVAKFQHAVMARAQLAKADRRNFYLYIDEFQTFTGAAGTSYEKILSRARKYKLGLVLAHQQTAQIPGTLLKEIMGNVSTTICFNVSREDASRFSREFVTEFDGEMVHVPEEEILRLGVGQAWCKMGRHAFLMHTYLPTGVPSARRAAYVIEEAKRNYGGRLLAPPLPPVENRISEPLLDDLDPGKVF